MYTSKMLIKRNLLLYFRNKSAMFFSLLASIITLVLYLFFINNSLISTMKDSVENIETLKIFLNSLVICGVISLNTFTIPLSFMGIFINDRERGALKDFFVTPVKKSVVIFSYIICAVMATLLINIIIVAFLIFYLIINDVFLLSLSQFFLVLVFYLFCNSLFATIAFFIANMIKSSNAYGNVIGLCSALVGFLSGVYMPIGNFENKAVETVISLFPITQLNAVLKQNFMEGITSQLFLNAPENIKSFYEYFFGIELVLFNTDITLFISFIYLTILFFIFIFLSKRFVKAS